MVYEKGFLATEIGLASIARTKSAQAHLQPAKVSLAVRCGKQIGAPTIRNVLLPRTADARQT